MSEWMQYTLVICGALITILTLWNMIDQRVSKTRQPTNNLEERVGLLEKKMEFEVKAIFAEYDARFGRDKTRMDKIEEGSRVTMRAIRALLEHSIDGNNTNGLRDSMKELNTYLENR